MIKILHRPLLKITYAPPPPLSQCLSLPSKLLHPPLNQCDPPFGKPHTSLVVPSNDEY
jgi:hypothetical protein